MIKNEAEFQQALAQLQRMYRALADLRQEVLPKNPRMFAVMAEGPMDHIHQFQQEIESYVGAAQIADHEPAQVEEHEGDLREIDLDTYSFIIRNVGDIQQIPCSFEEDLLESAKQALDRRIKVSGTRLPRSSRHQAGKLHVTRLVVMEQDREHGTPQS